VIFGVHVVDAAFTVRDHADPRGLFGEGGHDVVDLVLDPDLQVTVRTVFFRHDSLTTVGAQSPAGLGRRQETAWSRGLATAHYKERAARRLIHPGRKKALTFSPLSPSVRDSSQLSAAVTMRSAKIKEYSLAHANIGI
jgi:hypothetical protein